MNTVNPIFICNYFNLRFTWDWKNNSLLRVLKRGIPPRGQDAWSRTRRISYCFLTLDKPISHRYSMIMRDLNNLNISTKCSISVTKNMQYLSWRLIFATKHYLHLCCYLSHLSHRTKTRLWFKILTTTWMSRTSRKISREQMLVYSKC